MEDAMLVYRIVRAPERRVFYIDVGNIPPEEIANYMEQAQTSLKRNKVVDKANGKMDLRYNPLAVDEDYFIPVRGGETGTKIDSLAGGSNAAAIEDVQYIQKKLFAALKIPKAYLGYDEEIGAKATLAQEDIRFSRTIARIQKVIISELNKMAMIHLYSHGYEGEDLLDFTLKLSLRAEKTIRNAFGKDVETERDRSTAASIEMPDMFKMAGVGSWARDQDTSNRVFDEDELYSMATESKSKLSLVGELYGDPPFPKPKMTPQIGSALKDMRSKIGKGNGNIITEDLSNFNTSGSTDE
jgi:hypothetical protein